MKISTLIILQTSILVAVLSKSIPDTEQPSTMLKLVASADGKSFFAENGARTWFESKSYCNSLNMRLASITSQRQSDVLNAAYHSDDFEGRYWTSGRDSQEIRQFSWDSTNEPISSNYPKYGWWNLTFQTCIYYHSKPEGASDISLQLCSARRGVLCEANTN